jgi:hypothetical protein
VSRSDHEAIVAKAQEDPVWFANVILGVQPWGKQQEILRALTTEQRVAIKACHGVGKTWLAAVASIWFLATRKGSKVATTAPTHRQVEMLLWPEIRELVKNAKVPLGIEVQQLQLKVDDNWFAYGFATDNPTAAQGLHAKGGVLYVFDEACGIPSVIWNAIEGSLIAENCKILSIGNPTDAATEWFVECERARTFSISAYDSPNVKERREVVPGLVGHKWVEDKERVWKDVVPLLWYPRVMGEFPPQSQDALLKAEWLDVKIKRQLPVILGVDVARFGDDESVVASNDGRLLYAGRGKDTMELGKIIEEVALNENAVRINIDAVGIGGGVSDYLKSKGLPVREMVASRAASNGSLFANEKAETYWKYRVIAEKIGTWVSDDEAREQLLQLKYRLSSDGRITMEPKDAIKKRLGYSPDRAEAFIYAAMDTDVNIVLNPDNSTLMRRSNYA